MRIRITINALRTALVVAVLSQLLLPVHTQAQVRPVNDYGAIGLAQLLHGLNLSASGMMTGAHPDVEDAVLIA